MLAAWKLTEHTRTVAIDKITTLDLTQRQDSQVQERDMDALWWFVGIVASIIAILQFSGITDIWALFGRENGFIQRPRIKNIRASFFDASAYDAKSISLDIFRALTQNANTEGDAYVGRLGKYGVCAILKSKDVITITPLFRSDQPIADFRFGTRDDLFLCVLKFGKKSDAFGILNMKKRVFRSTSIILKRHPFSRAHIAGQFTVEDGDLSVSSRHVSFEMIVIYGEEYHLDAIKRPTTAARIRFNEHLEVIDVS